MRYLLKSIIYKKTKTFFFKISFLLLCFLFSINSLAQNDISTLKGKEIQNKVRLNFMPISLPVNEYPELPSTMGLTGLHYQIPLNEWLYAGTAFHFATTGDQGGLFTLGVELGFNQKIYKNLYLDGNFHFGGGGGYRIYINDGAFINSNIGLQYKKKNFSFGAQYSYLDFFTGVFQDKTFSLFVEIPSLLRFTDYKNAHKKFIATNISEIVQFFETLFNFKALNADIHGLTHIDAKVEMLDVISIAICAFLLSVLATLFPAWKASKVQPAEALRYE